MTEAWPLQWPTGRPRTRHPERSRFNVSFANARDELLRELDLLGARYAVLSTNVSLRRDGLPYANQPEPDDTAAAVYFERDGHQMCFACDRWDRVRDNIQAVRHTIAALRGIERWGTGDMVAAAFTGFTALPAPGSTRPWRSVLGVNEYAYEGSFALKKAEEGYRRLAREHHPDAGGSDDQMAELNDAIRQARQELSA